MNPSLLSEALIPPPAAWVFSQREIDLAHELAALGIEWRPAPGMFLYDDKERFTEVSPIQPHIYVLLDYERFVHACGGLDHLLHEWTWLPTWQEGRRWLKHVAHRTDAEVLDRIRERVVDFGLPDREALYELMVAEMRTRRSERPPA